MKRSSNGASAVLNSVQNIFIIHGEYKERASRIYAPVNDVIRFGIHHLKHECLHINQRYDR